MRLHFALLYAVLIAVPLSVRSCWMVLGFVLFVFVVFELGSYGCKALRYEVCDL